MRVLLLSSATTKLRALCRAMNTAHAARFRGKLTLSLLRLRRHPELGHRIPEDPTSSIRQVIVEDYRIFYAVDRRRRLVLVLEIWHGAQIALVPELPAGLE